MIKGREEQNRGARIAPHGRKIEAEGGGGVRSSED
jgi:hypothetical protein